MTALAEYLRGRFFKDADHPYRLMERRIETCLRPEHTVLDAGCGRTAPVLVRYRGRARRLIGIDLVEFTQPVSGIEPYCRDLNATGLADCSVDLVMARSVMEHVEDPLSVYREMYRVLRPGGRFVFLTANFWDYASLVAMAVRNRLHPWIVSRTEGREEVDVFPTRYRTNTRRRITELARQSGLQVESFAYLGQYPGYFMFNGLLFLLATGYEKLISRFDGLAWLRGWILAVLQRPMAIEGNGPAVALADNAVGTADGISGNDRTAVYR